MMMVMLSDHGEQMIRVTLSEGRKHVHVATMDDVAAC